MRENAKRTRSHGGNHDRDNKNQRRRHNNNNNNNYDKDDDKPNDELVIYRILCPAGVIGSVIGKSGKVINSIRQETRAKVKVVDPIPGATHRVIRIYCYAKHKDDIDIDDIDKLLTIKDPLCAAQDALLRLHAAITNALGAESDKRQKDDNDKDECLILVPSSQSANIIGKAGSIIKKLRVKSRANIKVNPKDPKDLTHSCAMDFDNFVMITGEPEAVKKALFAVSAIMYKFTPREEIPLETSYAEPPPSIIIPSDVPMYPPGRIFTSRDHLLPSGSISSILGPTHVPELHGFRDIGSDWPIYSSALPGLGSASKSEELIVRVLCPSSKIGFVIGKGGGTIKTIRQASGARIEVDDNTKADRNECVITVIASEAEDDLKSMAVEAVLLLQAKINDEEADSVTMRLLVSSKVIGCIIGKSGSIINEIRRRTKADIRISKGNKLMIADANDELIEVVGAPNYVRDAIIQIVLRLRDDALKVMEGGHNPSAGADPIYLRGPPIGYDQRPEAGNTIGLLSSSSLYGYGSLPMADSGYGSMPSHSSKLYGGVSMFSPPSDLEVLIPANAVGKVLGKAGANISNIRKISGAIIEITESRSSRGDRVALIAGTAEQKRTADNLIQAFIMAT
ncbi:hypothetical protein ACFE04_015397 [Oxalis oulophora]